MKPDAKVVATRDVHVAGLAACSAGSILPAGSPLVAAVPDAFTPADPPARKPARKRKAD